MTARHVRCRPICLRLLSPLELRQIDLPVERLRPSEGGVSVPGELLNCACSLGVNTSIASLQRVVIATGFTDLESLLGAGNADRRSTRASYNGPTVLACTRSNCTRFSSANGYVLSWSPSSASLWRALVFWIGVRNVYILVIGKN